MKRIIMLVGGFIILMAAASFAAETDAVLGEKLVREIFADPASAKLAQGFQSIHQDGARDYDAEKKMLKNIVMRDFTLSNFKVTREANVLVVTYAYAGHEIIDGKQTSSRPAPRLSVFIQKGAEWQWLAHANLIPIKTVK